MKTGFDCRPVCGRKGETHEEKRKFDAGNLESAVFVPLPSAAFCMAGDFPVWAYVRDCPCV